MVSASAADRSPLVLDFPTPDVGPGSVTTPRGFEAAGVHAGVKEDGADLALIASKKPCATAGVFTTNQVKAPSVLYCQRLVPSADIRAIVVNSGNANACTGDVGVRDNQAMADYTAEALAIESDAVLVASTGAIGFPLPMTALRSGIPKAAGALSPEGGLEAAKAIMTTDLVPKSCSTQFEASGTTVTLGGIAKGSGMIEPNMATTFAFVTTDAQIAPDRLQASLRRATQQTFNRITVDQDTSTNDSIFVLANGASGVSLDAEGLESFDRALHQVLLHLALAVVRDGEGANRIIEVRVSGATDELGADRVARTVASSPLVKTAFVSGEPNWGRFMMAIGRAGVPIVESSISIQVGSVPTVRGGLGCLSHPEDLRSAMLEDEVVVAIDLAQGDSSASVFTCDLSEGYVQINSSYIS